MGVWAIGPEPSNQIMSIYSEGVARGAAKRYPETIYFFAELVNEEDHDVNTLFKVYQILDYTKGLSCEEIILELQNKRILFRERM